MTIVLNFFIALVALGMSSDSGSRKSREVDSYLRSMSKIKPNWPEKKILRSARVIYGDDVVPQSMRPYRPGTAPERTSGTAQFRVEGMTADEKKHEIFRIRRAHPASGTRDIMEQFKFEFPLEPNPPDWNSVRGYLFFQNVDERIAILPEVQVWARLGPEMKAIVSHAGMGIMKRRYLANPQENWETLLFETVSELNQLYGVRISASSVYKWYLEARKEAIGHGSKRGPKRPRKD